MKTITFYSYKGGVGRTMALANVAWRLAEKGKRIGIIDLDLEAPGLSLVKDFTPGKKKVGGLSAFLNRTPQEVARSRGDKSHDIESFCYIIESEQFKYPGKLFFLPVGEEAGLSLAKYLDGEAAPDPLLAVKKEFADLDCQYLLVDSRTGISATSGIAAVMYPDQVVMVLGLNSQNIRGTHNALRTFRKYGQNIFFNFLPSLVPYGEEKLKEKAFAKIKKMLRDNGLPEDRLFIDLWLPYHPQLAVEDRPMLLKGVANFLAERYLRLTETLIAQNEDDPLTRMARAVELLRNNNPHDALRLIGPFYGQPPFDNHIDFLKLYGAACYEAGFNAESDVPLTRAMELEARQDRESGGKGVPTIKTALLYNQRLKKGNYDRTFRLSFLQKIKSRKFRGSDDDLSNLYNELIEAYGEAPIDLDGLIKFNAEIVQIKPSFSARAVEIIANVHTVHGQLERAHSSYVETVEKVKEAVDRNQATKRDLASVFAKWAKLYIQLRDWKGVEEKVREMLEFLEGNEKIKGFLELTEIIGKAADNPTGAMINCLEDILQSEPFENTAPVLKKLASLYEREGRLEEAIEYHTKLLTLEPWDRRDIILRIQRLKEKLGITLDEEYEQEVRRWLEQSPDDLFTIFTLAELLFLKGDYEGFINIYLKRAKTSDENIDDLVVGMRDYTARYWKNRAFVSLVVTALRDPVFTEYAVARNSLSFLLSILGKWEEALKASVEGVPLAKPNIRIEYVRNAIHIMERLGKWEEALAFVEKEFQHHVDDVNWPIAAAQVYLRASVRHKGEERKRLLDRALEILENFEKQTGAMQLANILPLRYHILVERLGDEAGARADLNRIIHTKYPTGRMGAIMAVPDAEYIILLSKRDWDDALEQADKMARYANDEDRWKIMMKHKAELLFLLERTGEALDTIESLGEEEVEKDMGLRFLQLRCFEALGLDDKAGSVLARIRYDLESGKVESMNLGELAYTICCELRFKDKLSKVADAVQWIEIRNSNRWKAYAQSTVLLYHLCFGSPREAEVMEKRLEQIGYYYGWVPGFLHDLGKIKEIHGLEIDLDSIRDRFPLQ
jgi:MinD-like ATPase involved in chromosome partitioning or flagellar assembly/tetratricopeptide (TPR) repeat protein